MKPMLASDVDLDKLRLPCGVQPKIDGVRGLSGDGVFTARSLKPHANRYTSELYNRVEYRYFDGELAAERETHPDLCRLTSSALSTIEGQPFTLWWVFDYIAPHMLNVPYLNRYNELKFVVEELKGNGLCGHLRVVPMEVINSLEEYLYWEDVWLSMGYEGIIVRDLDKPYKQGRSTMREMGLVRGKRFLDFEMTVTRLIEGEANGNEAQTNELGNTFRSTHQENMVPNGMVGAVEGVLLSDVIDPHTKQTLLYKGQIARMGAGQMPHNMRSHYWANQHELVDKIAKGKFFPKGMKDKPRFPIFQSVRDPNDMS